MPNYNLSELALQATCPGNKLIYDSKGIPSVMVWIPKFKMSDVITGASENIHPAFIVNGEEIDGFWASKYQNVVVNDLPYSIPCEDPATHMQIATAILNAANKGNGFHCMTRAEWAAIALWCLNNNFQPKGNNDHGKDVSETDYLALPTYESNSQIVRVATGSGPVSWAHNNAQSGIWDLNGNIEEWQAGIRIHYGELQILANNDAADSDNSQDMSSAQWKCIKASDGTLITPAGYGNTSGAVKLDYVSSHWQWDTSKTSSVNSTRSAAFGKTTCSANIGTAAKELLQALCLAPSSATESDYNSDQFYANNNESNYQVFTAGGEHDGVKSGVFALKSVNRSLIDYGIGYRSAYVDIPSA